MIQFTRVWDANSAFQAHISEDVNFVILPVLDGAAVVGFRVYDLRTGELDGTDYKKLHEAKEAIDGYITEGVSL